MPEEELPAAEAAANETPVQKQARLRREKLLAKAALRMQVVNGEVKLDAAANAPAAVASPASPAADAAEAPADAPVDAAVTPQPAAPASPVAASIAAAPVATPTETPTTARWEQKWQADVAVAEKRELPREIEHNLDVTTEMFSEAPKAAAIREEIKLIKLEKPKAPLPLESLLAFTAVVLLAVATSARAVPDAMFTFPLVLVFLVLRLALSSSLTALNLAPPRRVNQVTSSSAMNAVIQILPPPIANAISSASRAAFVTKESLADVCLFVVAYGLCRPMFS